MEGARDASGARKPRRLHGRQLGKVADVVIDPTSQRVTHLVVERGHELWQARLVPVELAERGGDSGGAVALRATVVKVRRLTSVHDVAYLRLDGFPVDDPNWDVGVEEVLALPYYPSYDLEPAPVDFAVRYGRVPKGEVEIRRASAVESADAHHLGDVDGFLVDDNQLITHVVLEQGDPLERREVLIPIGAVPRVETDGVTLSLTKDEVGALPPWRFGAGRARSSIEDRRGGTTGREC
jgi:sporulation protein YlmC with PRC-barrel domain